MAYVIDKYECLGCGICADVCPVAAIDSIDTIYSINTDECLGCGSCADSCPQHAISEK